MPGAQFFDFGEYVTVLATVFAGASRAIGFLLLFPMFSWFEIDTRMRLALGLILSSPTIAALFATSAFDTSSALFVLLICVKELAIGMGLALVLGLPIYAFQTVGDVIDYARGALQPNLTDPVSAATSSDLGRVMIVIGLLWMVASGAFSIALEILIVSHKTFPVAVLNAADLSGPGFIDLLEKMTLFGLRFAAPILLLMFAVMLAIGFATAGGGNIDMNDQLATMKNLVMVVAVPVYLILLVDYVGAEFVAALATARELMRSP